MFELPEGTVVVYLHEDAKQRIVVFTDYAPESPREWDNMSTFYMPSQSDYCCEESQDFESYEEMDEWYKELEKDGAMVFPIYIYSHSGVAMTVSDNLDSGRPGYPYDCPWDAGLGGFAVVEDPEKLKREQVLKNVEVEVKTYAAWCNGETFLAYYETLGDDGQWSQPEDSHYTDLYGYDWDLEKLLEWMEIEDKEEGNWNELSQTATYTVTQWEPQWDMQGEAA